MFVIFVLVTLVIGFAAMGAFFIFLDKREKNNCTYRTIGTVVGGNYEKTQYANQHDRSDRFSYGSSAYFPILEFTMNGQIFRQRSSLGGGRDFYPLGKQFEILVNPNNPVEFRFAEGGSFAKKWVLIMGIIVTLVVVGVAVIFFLL
ncbi:MAG: DUF3592 domain-containing protein [Eubacterium sp.]|nr:DUF3592 domain-containing protein [Eubacterium sp.]